MKNRLSLLLLQIVCCWVAVAVAGSACGAKQEEVQPSGVLGQGTLTLFGVSPTTLDPAVAAGREPDAVQYIAEIFSGLVCFDPDLDLVGDIAERWDRSNDGKTYTFYLRQGVKFHNGREATAYDVKYSLERACDPDTGAQAAESLLGDIVGARERLEGKTDDISGIRVVNDHTLEVTIDAPKEYFLSKLAHPVAFVVDRYNVESGRDWWKNPNGTGPFKLKEWQEEELMVLERNDLYYQELPKLKQVVYRIWGGVPMRLYESGEIDVANVSTGDIERVLDPANPLNKELCITAGFGLYYIGFNCTRPPFDDAKVRQAFCHAVDKDKMAELVLKGAVQEADGILPPGMPGYNPYVRGLDFDVDRAKQLIAESRYRDVSNLPPVALTSYGRASVSPLEAALVDMWRRNLGVEVEVRLWQPEVYFYIVMEEKDEMCTLGWSADYPDAQNFLDILFHTGSKDNIGEYSSAQVDVWLEQARTEQDATARVTLYRLAEQTIVNEAACLPLYFDVSYTLVKPYVKNLPLTPLWIPRLKYASIESN